MSFPYSVNTLTLTGTDCVVVDDRNRRVRTLACIRSSLLDAGPIPFMPKGGFQGSSEIVPAASGGAVARARAASTLNRRWNPATKQIRLGTGFPQADDPLYCLVMDFPALSLFRPTPGKSASTIEIDGQAKTSGLVSQASGLVGEELESVQFLEGLSQIAYAVTGHLRDGMTVQSSIVH